MSLTLRDFAAVAGSTSSIGYVKLTDGKLEKADHHQHLTSLNVKPAANDAANKSVRFELYNAINASLNAANTITPERREAFLASVARQLGVDLNDNTKCVCKPLDRRTVHALVKATEAELGQAGKVEKVSSNAQAFAAFFGGRANTVKLPMSMLMSFMESAQALFNRNEAQQVSDAWVMGDKGESFHVQKAADDQVTIDCGGNVKVTLSKEAFTQKANATMLALAGSKNLPAAQQLDFLNEVGRCFKGERNIKDYSGDSSPDIQFARQLSEKILLAKFGAEGLTANELRNVPPYTMHFLAKHAADGNVRLIDVRSYIDIACTNRFNSEETLKLLDMYQHASEADKDSVKFASERVNNTLIGKATNAISSMFSSFFSNFETTQIIAAIPGIKAMLADVISDTRTFLSDQHPEPGGRLQATLQSHTEALAALLCNSEKILTHLPKMAEGFVLPLVDTLKELLGDSVELSFKHKAEVQQALTALLARDDVKPKLVNVETAIDTTASSLCADMQETINTTFEKVFNTGTEQLSTGEKNEIALFEGHVAQLNATAEEKQELIDRITGLSEKFALYSKGNTNNSILQLFYSGVNDIITTSENENLATVKSGIDKFDQLIQPVITFLNTLQSNGVTNAGRTADYLKSILSLLVTQCHISIVMGTEIPNNPTLNNLSEIAQAYAKLRNPKDAIKALDLIALSIQQRNDLATVRANLNTVMNRMRNAVADPAKHRSDADIKDLKEFMQENGMDTSDLSPRVGETGKSSSLKYRRLKASRALLQKLGSGADMNKGYGLFMTKVMKEYVKSMSVMDQRAMLAAGIRFSKTGSTPIQQMGAFLKGAGPIMQKMLQGFASMDIDKEFLSALDDMKSKLPPIPADVVKACFLDMKQRSNGQIIDIKMNKSLGAASVGQAFLCTVTKADHTQVEVVVKLLRPEAEQRAEREKGLFIRMAKEVPGMDITFAGQLAGILDELDLRKEAENTKMGSVYDQGGMKVKSMKLLDLIAPTKYSMVVEKAPGTTVDRLIKSTEAKIEELTNPFFKKVTKLDNNQQPVKDESGKIIQERVPNEQAFKTGDKCDQVALSKAYTKTILDLSRLYEETLQQQKKIVALASKWTLHGIYSEGFYHGDLHAGNIMVDDVFKRDENGRLLSNQNAGLTVIDYGNATRLTPDQQEHIIKMMTAANTKDTNVFLENFCALMTPEGQTKFKAHITENHALVHNIFNLGNRNDSANRIFAALQQLQLKGYELPGPIFKFSQCSIRLQGTIDQMNALLEKISQATLEFREKIPLEFTHVGPILGGMNLHGQLLADQFKGGSAQLGDDNCDFVELQKMIDKKLEIFNPPQANGNKPSSHKPGPLPSKILMDYYADGKHIDEIMACERLTAPLAGLQNVEGGAQLYTDLITAKDNLITTYRHQGEIDTQIQNLKADLPDRCYENYVANKNEIQGLNETLQNLRGTVIQNFLKDLATQCNKFTNSTDKTDYLVARIQEHQAHILDRPKELQNFLFIAILRNRCYAQFDANEPLDVQTLTHNLETSLQEAIEERQIANNSLTEDQKVTIGVIDDLNTQKATSFQTQLRQFGVCYDAAQKKLLEDMKAQIAPICRKNQQGVVVSRLVPQEDLETFGNAVGHVIMDNVLSSVYRTGLGLAIKSGFKSIGTQAPKF